MTHPNEEELIEDYYAGLSSELKVHLDACSECACLYRNICETLDSVSDSASETPLPERDEAYGARVWARLQPHLPPGNSKLRRVSRWLLVPALAALLALVFAAGMWTERVRTAPIVLTGPHIATVTFPQPSVVVQGTPKKPARKGPKPRFAPSDTDQDQKRVALNTRLSEDQPAAMPELPDMITGPTSDKTREHALFVLEQSDAPEARQALLEFARQSANPPLQSKAIRMLGISGDADTLLAILKQEKDPTARAAAVNSLAAVNGGGALLTSVYRSDTNAFVRRAVLNALAAQHNDAALSELAREETDLRQKVEILRRLDSLARISPAR
jgi:hypothetical protein